MLFLIALPMLLFFSLQLFFPRPFLFLVNRAVSTCLLSLGLFVCNFLEKFTLRESCQTRKLFRPSLLIHSPSSVFPTIPPNKTDPWCWEEGYGFCSELVEWLSSICAFLVPITNAHIDYRWEAEHWVESSWHYLAPFMQWKTTAARGQGGLKVSKCSLFVFCNDYLSKN